MRRVDVAWLVASLLLFFEVLAGPVALERCDAFAGLAFEGRAADFGDGVFGYVVGGSGGLGGGCERVGGGGRGEGCCGGDGGARDLGLSLGFAAGGYKGVCGVR